MWLFYSPAAAPFDFGKKISISIIGFIIIFINIIIYYLLFREFLKM